MFILRVSAAVPILIPRIHNELAAHVSTDICAEFASLPLLGPPNCILLSLILVADIGPLTGTLSPILTRRVKAGFLNSIPCRGKYPAEGAGLPRIPLLSNLVFKICNSVAGQVAFGS